MRLTKILMIAGLLLLLAGGAQAYVLSCELQGPSTVNVGDTVTYDVYLDTEGESDIVIMGVGVQTENAVLDYFGAPDNTIPNPGILVDLGTFTWLAPTPAWGGVFPGSPVGFSRVTVDFAAASFTPTTATSSRELLATLSYTAVAEGQTTVEFDFYDTGLFELSGGTNVTDQVTLIHNDPVITVPEPSAAVAAFGVLGTLGLMRARSRRR